MAELKRAYIVTVSHDCLPIWNDSWKTRADAWNAAAARLNKSPQRLEALGYRVARVFVCRDKGDKA